MGIMDYIWSEHFTISDDIEGIEAVTKRLNSEKENVEVSGCLEFILHECITILKILKLYVHVQK